MNALALVIGNAKYIADKDKLVNAVNDAIDFGKKLLSLGFIVNTVTDCDRECFDFEVREYGKELHKFDVGLFYFSGHGLQIEGKNYLTSVDTSFADDSSAKYSSYPLDQVIEYMQKANPIVKILILDACRDNPLPNLYRGVQAQGLAPIYAPKGTIIAFSTSPGEKAMDYGSGRNSIYTGSLLNHIDDTNIPIEDFFKRVRTSVFTLSHGKQTSWEHTSLIGDFYFNSGQLNHSVELPYKQECIADKNFKSTGSNIDEIIQDLKSSNYYAQKPAIARLELIHPLSIDESSQFLLGRNILQTAIGGEFSAKSIIKNLSAWLKKYSFGQINHVLNGMLFEMYFNSKGQFRQENFKTELIDDIFNLQANEQYKSSFEFIIKQLTPFREYLYYFPTYLETAYPIEIQFESFDAEQYDGTNQSVLRLVSIKHSEVELFDINIYDKFEPLEVSYQQFLSKLSEQLSVPRSLLRISVNRPPTDLKNVYIPWKIKLLRQK